jgi:hypothetical protein
MTGLQFVGDNNLSNNFIIRECYLTNVSNSKATNFLVANNIIGAVVFLSQSEISSNLFTLNSNQFVRGEGCVIKNNIFIGVIVPRNPANNDNAVGSYFNNFNCTVNGIHEYAQGSGNYLGVYASPAISPTSLFINYPQGNYHLTPAAAQTYLGTDNTQIGIYGGRFPWKDGSMPFNPWIKTFNAATQTSNNGQLRVTGDIKSQRD